MKKLVGILAALVLLAAACGDRGEDTSGGAGGGGNGGTTAPEDGGGGDGAEDAAPGDFGDLEGVCGPNEGGGAVPAEDAQGVSADAIKLGTVADPGYSARPGLNQEIFDAGEAFAKWCNDAGGINGKKIELTLHDAKLTEYRPAIEAACRQDFALVGGGAVQDNLWPEVGVPCGLIDIAGFAVTADKAGTAGQDPTSVRTVQPVPNPSDRYPVGPARLLQEDFPEAGKRMGILFSDFQTLVDQKNKEKQAFEAIDHEVVHEAAYNVMGETNWKPFATAMEQADVQMLKFIGEAGNAGALEAAMAQTGYQPEVRLYETNFYDQKFIDTAGDAAEGAFMGLAYVPLEEADSNPATKQYMDMVDETGGKHAVLGLQSMSAWMMFATVAKECDLADDLTRTCILETASEVEEWTGGGLHAPTKPASNIGSDCWMVVRVEGGKFERYAPDEGFSCDPEYQVEVG